MQPVGEAIITVHNPKSNVNERIKFIAEKIVLIVYSVLTSF